MRSPQSDSARPLSILVVDDHLAVRAGLSQLVAADGMVVSNQVASLRQTLECVDACRPDAAIVDLMLDGEDGLAVVSTLAARRIPVLVYSMHADGQHVRMALSAGALGYVTKAESHEVLTDGLREISSGSRYLSPKAAVALAAEVSGHNGSDSMPILSRKEREVFRRLGEGDGTAEIAEAMRISVHTVESYYARIQLKLGIQGMYDLRHRAIEAARHHLT